MALHRKPRKEAHPVLPSLVYFTVGALLLFGATFTVSDQVDDAVDPDDRNGITAPLVPVDTDNRDRVDSVTAPTEDAVTVTPEAVPPPEPRAQPDAVEVPVPTDTDADGVTEEVTPPVEVPSIVPNPPANVQPFTAPPLAPQPLAPFVPTAPTARPVPASPAPLVPTVPVPSPTIPVPRPSPLAPITDPVEEIVAPLPIIGDAVPEVIDAVEPITDPLAPVLDPVTGLLTP